MKESWKQRHLHHLKFFYGKLAEKWKDITTDDRLVFVNTYRMMIDALESLPEEPVNYVCVAMNKKLRQDRKTLDSIAAVFQGR